MEFKTLSLEKKGSIALLKFVRPEVMNAFNSQQVDEMKIAITNLAGDKEIRVVILSGEGKAFTSGADLSEKEAKWENVHDALIEGYLPSLKGIIEMPKLVIASINGPAAAPWKNLKTTKDKIFQDKPHKTEKTVKKKRWEK